MGHLGHFLNEELMAAMQTATITASTTASSRPTPLIRKLIRLLYKIPVAYNENGITDVAATQSEAS